jgi:hypothetical protein
VCLSQWATDSVKTARTSKAYAFARLNGEVRDNHQGEAAVRMKLMPPPAKAAYITSYQSVAAAQLTKAAVRLADMLNHIAWK